MSGRLSGKRSESSASENVIALQQRIVDLETEVVTLNAEISHKVRELSYRTKADESFRATMGDLVSGRKPQTKLLDTATRTIFDHILLDGASETRPHQRKVGGLYQSVRWDGLKCLKELNDHDQEILTSQKFSSDTHIVKSHIWRKLPPRYKVSSKRFYCQGNRNIKEFLLQQEHARSEPVRRKNEHREGPWTLPSMGSVLAGGKFEKEGRNMQVDSRSGWGQENVALI